MEDLKNVSKETAYGLGYIKGRFDAVVYGQWDKNGYCYVCGFWTCYCGDYNYCPKCGAKMCGGSENG